MKRRETGEQDHSDINRTQSLSASHASLIIQSIAWSVIGHNSASTAPRLFFHKPQSSDLPRPSVFAASRRPIGYKIVA